MVVAARIVALLVLLFVLVTVKLSKAVHGGEYAAGRYNNHFASTSEDHHDYKGQQTLIGNKSGGRKLGFVDRHARDLKEFRNLVSKENYRARFVAFNADYKGPRRHPPKNN